MVRGHRSYPRTKRSGSNQLGHRQFSLRNDHLHDRDAAIDQFRLPTRRAPKRQYRDRSLRSHGSEFLFVRRGEVPARVVEPFGHGEDVLRHRGDSGGAGSDDGTAVCFWEGH